MKNTGAAIGDFKGQICPVRRFSSRKASNSTCSNGDRGYTFDDLGSALGISSIVLSHLQCSSSMSKSSLANTDQNSVM